MDIEQGKNINNIESIKIMDRKRGIAHFKKEIENYSSSPPFSTVVWSIDGRPGIGKTWFVKKIHAEVSNDRINPIYINASDCHSISMLLLKLRMQLKKSKFDFSKFDLVYQFYFDSYAFLTADQQTNIYEEYQKKIGEEGKEKLLTKILGKDNLEEMIEFFHVLSVVIGEEIIEKIGLKGLKKICNRMSQYHEKKSFLKIILK